MRKDFVLKILVEIARFYFEGRALKPEVFKISKPAAVKQLSFIAVCDCLCFDSVIIKGKLQRR